MIIGKINNKVLIDDAVLREPEILTRWQDPTIDEMKNRINDLLKENTEWKLENERLNNIINELEKWFKEYHKYQNRLKWYETDYIEFIENLEKELKEGNNETKKEY